MQPESSRQSNLKEDEDLKNKLTIYLTEEFGADVD